MSRFDRRVISILVTLAALIGLVAWRGDRVGAPVVSLNPAPDAAGVSTRAVIRVTFGQEMATDMAAPLLLNPTVSGTLRWEGKTLAFTPSAPLAPETTYTVTLAAGLASQQGRPVLAPPTWRFTTGQTRLLFIGRDNKDHDQLTLALPARASVSIAPAGGAPIALTQESFGVWDYALSSDGTAIVYAAMRRDGGSDLVTIAPDGRERRKRLDCSQAMCNGAAWLPDGQRLIYERHALPAPGAFPAPGRLWMLNLDTGQTEPLFQDSQKLGFGPRISPDGQWLAYFAPSEGAVQLVRLSDGRNLMAPSQMGEPPVWNPRGDAVAMSDILFMGERTAVHLFRVDLESSGVTDISGDESVDDGAPDWSPDGEWIAFRRKSPAAAMSAQIWVMRRDGTQARQLTDDERYFHSALTWSPDGRTLAIQRVRLEGVNVSSGIWLLDVTTGQLRELVSPGARPTWLP